MANGNGTQTAQATSASAQPPPPVPDHLSDLRISSLDTDELQQRTLQQARAALPQPQSPEDRAASFADWENQQQEQWAKQHPILPPNSRLGQAYAHLKDIVGRHEGQVSEKYLKPFRDSLDRMSQDLVAAGESGHTKTGGQLTTPARLMTLGVGHLLGMVPVGHDVQSTIAANVVPPEFPEGKAVSKELRATEKAAQKVLYHSTAAENVPSIAREGLKPSESPQWGGMLGDESRGKAFLEDTPQGAHYYGEIPFKNKLQGEGQASHPVSLRVKLPKGVNVQRNAAEYGAAKTGESFVENTIHPENIEVYHQGKYKPIREVTGPAFDWEGRQYSRSEDGGYEDWEGQPVGETVEHVLDDVRTHALPEKAEPKTSAPGRKALPPQPRLPNTGTHAAIKTDDGSIYFDDAPEKQRTHIMLAKDLGIPPERVVSGGWLQDGHYEASERSDAGRWAEQARAKAAVAEKRAARAQSELPAPTATSAEAKAKERAANLRGLGIGLTEMNADDAKNWVGYTNQKSIKVFRGVDDAAHAIEPGDFVTTSKESAQNYGRHVQEMEVSPEELRYVRGHKDGNPKLLDQGGQTELIYAPKATTPQQVPATDDQILNHFDKKYPAAKETVDGHTVREHVPNYDSISASLAPNYEVLDGVREIPMSHFDDPGSVTPRTRQLAADIKQSGELNPLIVAIDHRGPYILEGGHRFDALRINKAKSFPAVVALDLNKGFRPNVEEELAAGQTETLYHGSPDVSKIDQLKPGSKGGYFGDGIYLTRDPDVARRFTKLEAMNPTLERNADGSFTDINTGKRIPGGKPGVLETTLKDARLKKITMDEMDAEIEKFRKPNGVIDLDGARNAISQKYAKQGYDGFDVAKSKYFDEPQVVIFPSSAKKLSINKPEAKSPYTAEGAQPLADRLGAKVVGSVATGKTSPDPYGINRGPKDLDLRIEGEYQSDDIQSKLKAEGYEFRGSSVLSPQEQKASGKNYGKPGWKRAEHFENSAGQKIDVWHDETGPVVFRNGRRIDVSSPKKLK